MKRFLVLSLLILITVLSSKVYAQTNLEPIKIGVIDIKRVINTSKYGQEVMEKLQQKYDELKGKLEVKAKEIDELREEIEKKANLWSQEVREKKQSEYQRKLREFKVLQEDVQLEMQEYEKKLLDPVFQELEIVIKNFVEKENYDLILEKTQPGIYYASPKIDLSPKIVDLFNIHYEKKLKEGKQTLDKTIDKTIKTQPSPKK